MVAKIEIPHYTVICDSREKEKFRWDFQKDNECDGTIISKLDTGDYTIQGYEKEFVIERKLSTNELCVNIYEKRFKDVLDRLRQFKYKFIVCEFSFDNIINFPIASGIPPYLYHKVKASADFMLNCITKWQLVYGINLVFAGKYGMEASSKLFKYFMKYGRNKS